MIDSPSSAGDAIAPPSDADLLHALLAFAGSAPTWAPELPWSVVRVDSTVQLRLLHMRDELLHDPANREVVMACGAALENLRVAARHLGRELVAARWPNGEDDPVVVAVALGDVLEPRHEDDALFFAMTHAGVHADPSAIGRGVSPALVAVLRHAARCEGGWLDVVADEARRELVGDLESEAVTLVDAERAARLVLALRIGRAHAAQRPVAVSTGGAPALAQLLSALGANVREADAWNVNRAAIARGATVTAPLLAILGSATNSPDGWLDAGAALQRVLLHAKVQGLTATLLNDPLHHPLLRDALRSLLFAGGAPHAIVRFDFVEGSHRRDRTGRNGSNRTAA